MKKVRHDKLKHKGSHFSLPNYPTIKFAFVCLSLIVEIKHVSWNSE